MFVSSCGYSERQNGVSAQTVFFLAHFTDCVKVGGGFSDNFLRVGVLWVALPGRGNEDLGGGG